MSVHADTNDVCLDTGDNSVLRQVRVPIIDRNTCNGTDYYGGTVTDVMMCAGYPQGGKDSCQVFNT